MTVPNSLCEYYRNPAVRRAVNELAQRLDGNNTPELDWGEARNYNRALLSAAQVRADFIEFLFSVWENSFGQAEPERLRGEYFEWYALNPREIWNNGELERCYYRNGEPEMGGRSDTLGVALYETNKLLYLYVGRYNEQEELVDLAETEMPEGWRIEHFDGDGYLVNCSADILDLCEDSAKTIERFVQDARAVVGYLLEN